MPPKKQSVVISIRLDDLSLKAVDLLVEEAATGDEPLQSGVSFD